MDYYNTDLPEHLAPDENGRFPYSCDKPDCLHCEIMATAQIRSAKMVLKTIVLKSKRGRAGKKSYGYRPATIDIKKSVRIISSGKEFSLCRN